MNFCFSKEKPIIRPVFVYSVNSPYRGISVVITSFMDATIFGCYCSFCQGKRPVPFFHFFHAGNAGFQFSGITFAQLIIADADGWLQPVNAYCAKLLSFPLHSNNPIVLLSFFPSVYHPPHWCKKFSCPAHSGLKGVAFNSMTIYACNGMEYRIRSAKKSLFPTWSASVGNEGKPFPFQQVAGNVFTSCSSISLSSVFFLFLPNQRCTGLWVGNWQGRCGAGSVVVKLFTLLLLICRLYKSLSICIFNTCCSIPFPQTASCTSSLDLKVANCQV